VSTMLGHAAPVATVAYSPDGKWIASGAADGTARLWDASTAAAFGAERRAHGEPVTSVSFSPDGRRLVTASMDRTIKLWDPFESEEVATLSGHGTGVLAAAFSPDGRRIATACANGAVEIWDTESRVVDLEATHLEGALRARVQTLVDRLFAESRDVGTVVRRLEEDPTLADPVRRVALDLARSRPGLRDEMYDSCLILLKSRGRDASALRRAKTMARILVEIAPEDPRCGELQLICRSLAD
jgi:dipeptidyl aminopeptidase/acylaminoacyl peptidase